MNIGDFGEFEKLAILAIFCQFRQISSSTDIDTPLVNIGEFEKIDNFGHLLPIFV